jgi:SPP1 gp7 family putative phage head morphogenesis protein
MQSHLDLSVGLLDLDATSTTKEIEEGWRKTVQQITVHPELSAEGKALLAKNYTTNMRLWIKTFSEQQIEDLREVVEQNAQQGYRFDRLIERIKQREGVSRSKAKFLARQETGLFMSQYRARRFEDVGVKRYIWSTSHDVRVRDGEGGHGNHKVLDGKVFFYATKAPAQFMSSKTPCNPGEDYNCRCVDRPLPPHAAAEESLHA